MPFISSVRVMSALSKFNVVGGGKSDHYWSEHEPLLVEIPSYIGAHRAPIRGTSLRCDGAGSPRALVVISQRRKVDDSKYGKFVSLLGSIRSPMLGKVPASSEGRSYIGVLPILCHRGR